jgi:NADPH:quinone reductase-like Zn-dependent oxidoreductase
MRLLRVRAHGGPEVIALEEAEEPVAGPGEVRVRVTHVGLNHLDVWVRRGVPGHAFPLPLVPGADVVGVREDTGAQVALHPAVACMTCRSCASGRHDLCRSYRIRGERMDGGCAEVVCVPSWQLLPADGLDPAEAASLPLALLTAWHLLLHRARLAPGERVVVMGGAGGVASLAIQVAVMAGARVAAVASTPEKRARCLALGAEVAWAPDAAAAGCKAWTERQGADVVVEHVGGAAFALGVSMLRWGGRLATCGATAGHEVTLDLRALFFKQLELLGSTMGGLGELAAAWDAVRAGRIRGVVGDVLPMRDIAEAHRRIEERAVLGKIVLSQDLGQPASPHWTAPAARR